VLLHGQASSRTVPGGRRPGAAGAGQSGCVLRVGWVLVRRPGVQGWLRLLSSAQGASAQHAFVAAASAQVMADGCRCSLLLPAVHTAHAPLLPSKARTRAQCAPLKEERPLNPALPTLAFTQTTVPTWSSRRRGAGARLMMRPRPRPAGGNI